MVALFGEHFMGDWVPEVPGKEHPLPSQVAELDPLDEEPPGGAGVTQSGLPLQPTQSLVHHQSLRG